MLGVENHEIEARVTRDFDGIDTCESADRPDEAASLLNQSRK
jgi:hypothetical protein